MCEKVSSNRRVENPFIGILKSSHQREWVIIFPFSCNPTRPPEFFAYLYIAIPKRQKHAIYTPFPLSKVLTILISLMMEDESYRYDPSPWLPPLSEAPPVMEKNCPVSAEWQFMLLSWNFRDRNFLFVFSRYVYLAWYSIFPLMTCLIYKNFTIDRGSGIDYNQKLLSYSYQFYIKLVFIKMGIN